VSNEPALEQAALTDTTVADKKKACRGTEKGRGEVRGVAAIAQTWLRLHAAAQMWLWTARFSEWIDLRSSTGLGLGKGRKA
tara:strand:- start:333 stop:575 length:243 start_codon:yes stop_codon:yes gene_type:complete